MLAIILFAVSCIENDVPYPIVVPVLKEISVSGAESVEINSTERTVTAVFPEDTDLSSVRLSGAVFADSITVSSPRLEGLFDVSAPFSFVLTTYQDYRWKFQAVQIVERYFRIRGQIGASVIDEVNRRVVVYVPESASLSALEVLSCKLGPEGRTTYSDDVFSYHDFTSVRSVTIGIHGREEVWNIYVEYADQPVNISSLDAWTRVAWVSASGMEGGDNGFRYRKTGNTDWTYVPEESVKVDGGSFSACLDNLSPVTEYECEAFSDSLYSAPFLFTTEREEQLPNSGFEVCSDAESKHYFSWFDPASDLCNTKWWDSGNAGSTTVGSSATICCPDREDFVEGHTSARLNSKYVVIKFAAGNLFSGNFAGLVGTSGGMVDFGRPFCLRPRRMVLSLKYISGNIDHVGSIPEGSDVRKGDADRCQVFVALGDWDYHRYGGTKESPVRVNTTKRETFFDSEGENVIAYGSYVSSRSTDGWTEVEIPLEYRSTSRVPTHIIVSCAASMLGDYFTGSSSSVLWIDNIRLVY